MKGGRVTGRSWGLSVIACTVAAGGLCVFVHPAFFLLILLPFVPLFLDWVKP